MDDLNIILKCGGVFSTTVCGKTVVKINHKYYCSHMGGEIDEDYVFSKSKSKWIMKNGDSIHKLMQKNDAITYNPNLGFVYVIASDFGFKIGVTKSFTSRTKTFNVKLPFDWNYILLFSSTIYKKIEKELHVFFKSKHINGEWFNLSENDLNGIMRLPNIYLHLSPNFHLKM